jgi:hypothetical protein
MIAALLALVALNAVTQVVHSRREARLLDAIMARNAGEYANILRSDKAPKSKGTPSVQPEPLDVTGFPVGM